MLSTPIYPKQNQNTLKEQCFVNISTTDQNNKYERIQACLTILQMIKDSNTKEWRKKTNNTRRWPSPWKWAESCFTGLNPSVFQILEK